MRIKGGSSRLVDMVTHAVKLVAPTALVGTLLNTNMCIDDSNDESGDLNLPSPSNICRHQLSLDLAMVEDRRLRYMPDVLRYGWIDSSPVGGKDWLWHQVHEVPTSSIVDIFFAANALELKAKSYVSEQALSEASFPYNMTPLPEWTGYLQLLQNIKEHIFTPAATSSGHRGTAHKAAVMVHQWHLDVPTEIPLQDYADSYAGMCLDFGTEESVPDFHYVGSPEDLLPRWIHRGGLRSDEQLDEAQVVVAGDQQPRSFLPNALKVYGFQHTVNNLSQDVHKVLKYWEEFWNGLKVFSGLLNIEERRRRFCWTCLKGTVHAVFEPRLKSWSATLYEKQWKHTIKFTRKLRLIMFIFHLAWDHVKYLSGVDGDGKVEEGTEDTNDELAFDPAALTGLLKNFFWQRYLIFVDDSEGVVERRLGDWSENCNCHEPLYSDPHDPKKYLSAYKRQLLLRNHYGKGQRACPMGGKRADKMDCERCGWWRSVSRLSASMDCERCGTMQARWQDGF